MIATAPELTLTDYQLDLDRANKDVRELTRAVAAAPHDAEKRTRLAYRLYHRASLTGNFDDFLRTEEAIDAVVSMFGAKEDLCLLRAHLDFRFHRLPQVMRDLQMAPLLVDRDAARSLLADLEFQHGRYDRARRAYEDEIARNRTWDNLARLAWFKGKMGDVEAADRLYVEAEDELTAKEMWSFTWLELQRGLLDIGRGRYEDAQVHYERAARAYSGHWHVDEHRAEALAAQERFDDALALYLDVAARAPRPDLQQTIGELYEFIGRDSDAEPWYDAAVRGYMSSVGRGDVHYYHHLADFYTDVRSDPAAAVKWARNDLELRSNYATQAAMAAALSLNGEHASAVALISVALASGVQEAHLFATAASVYGSAGDPDTSAHLLGMATAVNPRYEAFHVHH